MHEKSAVWSGFPLESAVLHFLPCTVSCSGPLADSRRIARDQIQEGFLSGSDQIRCNRPKNVIKLPDLYCSTNNADDVDNFAVDLCILAASVVERSQCCGRSSRQRGLAVGS